MSWIIFFILAIINLFVLGLVGYVNYLILAPDFILPQAIPLFDSFFYPLGTLVPFLIALNALLILAFRREKKLSQNKISIKRKRFWYVLCIALVICAFALAVSFAVHSNMYAWMHLAPLFLLFPVYQIVFCFNFAYLFSLMHKYKLTTFLRNITSAGFIISFFCAFVMSLWMISLIFHRIEILKERAKQAISLEQAKKLVYDCKVNDLLQSKPEQRFIILGNSHK